MPQGKPDADYIRGLSVLGVQQIDRVVEVVEETLKGNQVGTLIPANYGRHEKVLTKKVLPKKSPKLLI